MNRVAVFIILGLFLVVIGFNWSRSTRSAGAPALLLESKGIWIQFGDGFKDPGTIRQYNDVATLADVILLTCRCKVSENLKEALGKAPIESGQRINLQLQEAELQTVSVLWMSAAQRTVLNIPLHPDRMTLKDWQFLPGVGPKMAARIEKYRQINGDFGTFSELQRVKGIGTRKLAAWREFF